MKAEARTEQQKELRDATAKVRAASEQVRWLVDRVVFLDRTRADLSTLQMQVRTLDVDLMGIDIKPPETVKALDEALTKHRERRSAAIKSVEGLLIAAAPRKSTASRRAWRKLNAAGHRWWRRIRKTS